MNIAIKFFKIFKKLDNKKSRWLLLLSMLNLEDCIALLAGTALLKEVRIQESFASRESTMYPVPQSIFCSLKMIDPRVD